MGSVRCANKGHVGDFYDKDGFVGQMDRAGEEAEGALWVNQMWHVSACRRKFALLVFKRRSKFRREDNEGSLVGLRKYAF
jgi:hypothetical protein